MASLLYLCFVINETRLWNASIAQGFQCKYWPILQNYIKASEPIFMFSINYYILIKPWFCTHYKYASLSLQDKHVSIFLPMLIETASFFVGELTTAVRLCEEEHRRAPINEIRVMKMIEPLLMKWLINYLIIRTTAKLCDSRCELMERREGVALLCEMYHS